MDKLTTEQIERLDYIANEILVAHKNKDCARLDEARRYKNKCMLTELEKQYLKENYRGV